MWCRNKKMTVKVCSAALLATVEIAIVRCLFPSEAAYDQAYCKPGVADLFYKKAIAAHSADGMIGKLQAAWETWFESNTVALKKQRDRKSLAVMHGLTQADGSGGAADPGAMLAEVERLMGID
jgi:hypothetical protein